MPTIRTFLAIPLPVDLQQQLRALHTELGSALPGLRWTRPDTVHLTLRFFGAATVDDLEKIRASMLSVAFHERPFAVDLEGLGAFPEVRRPRVVWVGLTPTDPVQALYRACDQELGRRGLAEEPRPFVPHLTIGRFRGKGPDLTTVLATQDQQRIGQLHVSQLVLYESRLHPDGPRHIPLFTVLLGQQDDPLHNRIPEEGRDHV